MLFPGYNKLTNQIGSKTYNLYIADTVEKQQKGLSSINKLAKDNGMIFIFDKPGFYGFWMKDMKIPLDLIFLNENQIVDILENIQPETYPKVFTGLSPYNSVIELSEGEIKQSGIKIGDLIEIRRPRRESNTQPTP